MRININERYVPEELHLKLAKQVIRDKNIRKWILDCIKNGGWNPYEPTNLFEYNMPIISSKYKEYFESDIRRQMEEADESLDGKEYSRLEKLLYDEKDLDPSLEALYTPEGAIALVEVLLDKYY